MVAGFHGDATDLVALRRENGASSKGMTLAGVMRLCDSRQLVPRAIRCSIAELRRLRLPCILHWQFNHFVVLSRVRGDSLLLHDPARGPRTISLQDASAAFTGVALEVLPSRDFRRRRAPARLRLVELVANDAALRRLFPVAMMLALVSELLLLGAPFYLQVVIDQVLVKGDRSLLDVLAAGFLLLAVFQAVAMTMRQLVFQYLSQTTVFDMSSRLSRHLLSLPLHFFQVRELGDIQQRLQALSTIRNFLTQTAPRLVLDGVFLLLVTAMLFVYAPAMSVAVLAAALVYGAWRMAIFRAMFRHAHAIARAEAATQTHLLETLRAAQTIKMSAIEATRLSDWKNLFATRVNTEIRSGHLRAADAALHHVVFNGLRIATVYLLAREAIQGGMTIGQLSAFVAYLGMFVTRATAVVNYVAEFRLLRVPLERLGDIIFHDTEAHGVTVEGIRAGPAMSITLRDVEYRPSRQDSPILSACSLRVAGGEFVAIRGRSGSGKSTLLRVIAGLVPASSGQLIYEGKPGHELGAADLRNATGAVLQGDVLLSGTVAENIVMFVDDVDLRDVRRAAQSAMIDEEIEAMPMAYQTRIGDLGSALSAGQTQRILLARALYGRPGLLLLDEVTGGLDAETERLVVASLRRLEVTRIVVTHSEAVMRAADRVIDLVDGCLLSRSLQSRYAGGNSDSSCR